MKESNTDSAIRICCPKCHHLFEAEEDFLGSKVQCGVCDEVFMVEAEHFSHGREREFYPGEKAESLPFHNLREGEEVAEPVVKKATGPTFRHPLLSKMTATHYLAAGVAILFFVLGVGLLGLSPLFDASREMAPLVVAGLLGAMVAGLWIYSQIDRRGLGVLVGVLGGLAVMAMPWVRKAARPEKEAVLVDAKLLVSDKERKAEKEKSAFDRNFQQIGADVLDKFRKDGRYAGKPVVGIFIRNLGEANRLLMSEYLLRETGASPDSLSYPREKGILFVLLNPQMSFAEIEKLAAGVAENGAVEHVWAESNVIELTSNNQLYSQAALEDLTNRDSEQFYILNRAELENLDLDRVMKAVDRLADVPPREFRVDVVRRAVRLLSFCKDGQDCERLCRLLRTWAPAESSEASQVAAKVAGKLYAEGKEPGRDTVLFLGSRQEKLALPMMKALWQKDLSRWEDGFSSFGISAEPVLLDALKSPKSVRELFSAVRLLGRVGGRTGLEALEKLQQTQNPSLKQELDVAIPAIRERLAKGG